jgi:peptidoglycan-associated lipoprotein
MRTRTIAISVAGALALLGACATTEEQPPAKVEERQPSRAQQPEQPRVATVDVTKPKPAAPLNPLTDPRNILSKRQIFFDYDKFDVKDEYRPLVEAHAKYLRENPSARMLIQGNADERGSREYNIGLGQRRSDSVKKMLVLLGARDNQLESVSLGEEKPICAESNEACWAKNRRGEMLYGGEY